MIRALSIQDLLFANTTLECESELGTRFQRLVRVGMPKITPNAIKCVFYLYETVKDATDGTDPRGTGFIVGVAGSFPRPFGWMTHLYAVTNWHIAVDDSDKDDPPCRVVRLKGRNGEPIILPFKKSDWRYIPGLDVAVAPITHEHEELDHVCIPVGMFLSENEQAEDGEVGVGDDIFMMGLFVDHHGGPTSVPAARFGNISMMPNRAAPVPQEKLPDVVAFVLDIHSRTGFSGSPVFVYRTFGSDLTVPVSSHFNVQIDEDFQHALLRGDIHRAGRSGVPPVRLNVEHETLFMFLGVHFQQFPEDLEGTFENKTGIISGLSGMTCAIPAWRIVDVLNLQEFADMRAKKDERLKREQRKRPRAEKAKNEPKDGDRRLFNRMLEAAVKPPKPSG